MSQVVIPFHVARGTYFASGNMFRAINSVVPGISAAAVSFQVAPLPPPALPAEAAPSQTRPPEESHKTPSKGISSGHSDKRGPGEGGTSSHGGDRGSSQKPAGGAPLMKQSHWDFKTKEQKIQTGGTPGSKRSSGGKKLDSTAINQTWVGFEREDEAHNTARRVLDMNPQPQNRRRDTQHLGSRTERGSPLDEGCTSQTEGELLLGRRWRMPVSRILPSHEENEEGTAG